MFLTTRRITSYRAKASAPYRHVICHSSAVQYSLFGSADLRINLMTPSGEARVILLRQAVAEAIAAQAGQRNGESTSKGTIGTKKLAVGLSTNEDMTGVEAHVAAGVSHRNLLLRHCDE